MAQTPTQRRLASRVLAGKLFPSNVTATLNLDDLLAAVGSIDDTMDTLASGLTGTSTVRQNLIARLPEPFKTSSTAQQKGFALALWAMNEVGLL